MQIDKSPFFRKPFIPWYAGSTACLIKAFLMFLTAVFAIDGIKVAGQVAAYKNYFWVPLVLLVLSAGIFAVNIIRFINLFSGDSASAAPKNNGKF